MNPVDSLTPPSVRKEKRSNIIPYNYVAEVFSYIHNFCSLTFIISVVVTFTFVLDI